MTFDLNSFLLGLLIGLVLGIVGTLIKVWMNGLR